MSPVVGTDGIFWTPRRIMLLIFFVLGATIEELREASEALQAGELDEIGFQIFRRHAEAHPADWRAHAMLGQAQGQRGEHGPAVEALRTAHALSPATAHVKIALASALTAKAHQDGENHLQSEAATLYRAALAPAKTPGALPDDPVQRAEAYANLGRALMMAADVENEAAGDEDESVAALSSAIALAPKQHEGLHELIALRLIRGDDPAQRARAIQAAQRAVKLSPASAEAYETLGATFFIGEPTASTMGRKHRARATRALQTAISLWEAAADGQSEPVSRSGRDAHGGVSGAQSMPHGKPEGGAGGAAPARARAHSRLSRLLSSDPKLQGLQQGLSAGRKDAGSEEDTTRTGNGGDGGGGEEHSDGPSSTTTTPSKPPDTALSEEGMELMREAVRHLRAAATLDPAKYSEDAAKVAGWEEAERQYKQADLKSQREREAMVMAMHSEIDGRRREKEEDEEIERERRNERDGDRDARPRKAGSKSTRTKLPKDEV